MLGYGFIEIAIGIGIAIEFLDPTAGGIFLDAAALSTQSTEHSGISIPIPIPIAIGVVVACSFAKTDVQTTPQAAEERKFNPLFSRRGFV